jgi:ribonuclease I
MLSLSWEVDFCEDEQRPQDVQLKDLLKLLRDFVTVQGRFLRLWRRRALCKEV